MSPEDVKKTTLITKSNLFDCNVMPFGMKNHQHLFKNHDGGVQGIHGQISEEGRKV
jgi:hypothetical protein